MVSVYNFHNKLIPHFLNTALYICNRSELFNSSAHLLSLGQSGALSFYSNWHVGEQWLTVEGFTDKPDEGDIRN